MSNNSQKLGEELNQLSRLLFNKAASRWYTAIAIEIGAGLLVVIIALLKLSDQGNAFFAFFGFLLLLSAYLLRLNFEDLYGNAETMRRQSVLTEALGWPIGKTQFSVWRQRAGNKILEKFKVKPRDEDYYATQETNSPKKLLEMTVESAFWTRHLYSKLRVYVWITFAIAVGILALTIGFLSLGFFSVAIQVQIAYAVYLLLPLILVVDFLGWGIRLGNLIAAIREIECDLEKLEEGDEPKVEEVLRLVAEYNCQVVSGFPIPNWFFGRHHDEIADLWKSRKGICE